MKHLKYSAASVLALLAANSAFAVLSTHTYVRFTGSTAFRASTITAIQNTLDAGYTSAANGADITGASTATFVGTYGGSPVVIQANWSGSVEGIRDITTGQSNTYIKGENAQAASFTNLGSTLTGLTETGVADITLADNTQGVTSFKSPVLTSQQIGVVPFLFLKGRLASGHAYKSAWDAFTNITPNGARQLLNGGQYLSILTGTADAAYPTYFNGGDFLGTDLRMKAYGLGRNRLSGTRLVTFAETGYGLTTPANQYKANSITAVVTAATSITAAVRYPAASVSGVPYKVGDNGFSSGGTLADELAGTVSAAAADDNGNPFGFVGYVGISDAARFLKAINTNAGTNTSYILSYNGASIPATYNNATQTTSWNFAAITEGRYSLWGYEYLMYKSTLSGTPKTFADAVATRLTSSSNTDATLSGIHIADMKVTRAADGAVIKTR